MAGLTARLAEALGDTAARRIRGRIVRYGGVDVCRLDVAGVSRRDG